MCMQVPKYVGTHVQMYTLPKHKSPNIRGLNCQNTLTLVLDIISTSFILFIFPIFT